MTALDLGLLIGILLQIGKASDLLLSNRQKKTVQNFSETVALKLDDAKPLDFFWRVFSKQRLKYILFFWVVILFISQTLLILLDNMRQESEFRYISFFVSAALMLFYCLTSFAVDYFFGSRLFEWLFGSQKFKLFLKRYAIVVLGYAILFQPLVFFMLFGLENTLSLNEQHRSAFIVILVVVSLYSLPLLFSSAYW